MEVKRYLKAYIDVEGEKKEVFSLSEREVDNYTYDEASESLNIDMKSINKSLKIQSLVPLEDVEVIQEMDLGLKTEVKTPVDNFNLFYFTLESNFIKDFDIEGEKRGKLYYVSHYHESISNAGKQSNVVLVEFNKKSNIEKVEEIVKVLIPAVLLLIPGGKISYLGYLVLIDSMIKIDNIYNDEEFKNEGKDLLNDVLRELAIVTGHLVDQGIHSVKSDYTSNDMREILSNHIFKIYQIVTTTKSLGTTGKGAYKNFKYLNKAQKVTIYNNEVLLRKFIENNDLREPQQLVRAISGDWDYKSNFKAGKNNLIKQILKSEKGKLSKINDVKAAVKYIDNYHNIYLAKEVSSTVLKIKNNAVSLYKSVPLLYKKIHKEYKSIVNDSLEAKVKSNEIEGFSENFIYEVSLDVSEDLYHYSDGNSVDSGLTEENYNEYSITLEKERVRDFSLLARNKDKNKSNKKYKKSAFNLEKQPAFVFDGIGPINSIDEECEMLYKLLLTKRDENIQTEGEHIKVARINCIIKSYKSSNSNKVIDYIKINDAEIIFFEEKFTSAGNNFTFAIEPKSGSWSSVEILDD